MAESSPIEWTDATWTPVRAQVKMDAYDIARAHGYTSLVDIAAKMAGHVGPHCERVSDACRNCYSETNNSRCLPNNGTGLPFDRRSRDLVDLFLDERILTHPLRWREPRRVFVCSQTDLFGEWVPDELILDVFDVMRECQNGFTRRLGGERGRLVASHTFQILTKRPARMLDFCTRLRFAQNDGRGLYLASRLPHNGYNPMQALTHVWLGVSAENQQTFDERVSQLAEVPAAVRFVSCEPLRDEIDCGNAFDDPPDGSAYGRIHWVIAGGESGPKARPAHPDWFRSLRDQCRVSRVPFFFKQWGEWVSQNAGPQDTPLGGCKSIDVHDERGWLVDGMFRVGKKAAGRLLDGRTWEEYPA